MVIERDSPAVAMLRDFISDLKLAPLPKPAFFQGLKTLEVTLEQLKQEEDLLLVDAVAGEWIASVPRDFEQPTFEQLMAHVVAIMFRLNRAFHRMRRARDVSRDCRPEPLKDDREFLGNYLLTKIFDTKRVPDFELQRGCVQMVADLLLRAKEPIIDDDQMPPEEFERLPLQVVVLELYKRARRLGPRYKEGEGSLEFQLLRSRALERLCRRYADLEEFVGPAGLDIYSHINGWVRLRRTVRRWWVGSQPTGHQSALAFEYWLLLAILLANFLLITQAWIPLRQDAAQRLDDLQKRTFERATEQILDNGRGGGN